MTTTPSIDTELRTRRIAATAATSAAFLSPRPIQRPAASAAASVTRASSIARLRSGVCGWSIRPPEGAVTVPVRPAHVRRARLVGMDARLLAAARDAIGFMPDDEGLALYHAGLEAASRGPLLEIGTYCGKSAVYLGAAARERGTILYTVDHHHGSEENKAGWGHYEERLVGARV